MFWQSDNASTAFLQNIHRILVKDCFSDITDKSLPKGIQDMHAGIADMLQAVKEKRKVTRTAAVELLKRMAEEGEGRHGLSRRPSTKAFYAVLLRHSTEDWMEVFSDNTTTYEMLLVLRNINKSTPFSPFPYRDERTRLIRELINASGAYTEKVVGQRETDATRPLLREKGGAGAEEGSVPLISCCGCLG